VLASGVSTSAAAGLAPEQRHVRFLVMVAGGRGEVVELADLLCGQLDAIGGGVLLDSGDPLGAGDRGDVVALGQQPGQGLWVPKIPSPHATCEYSWIRPPSRSRRRMRMLSSAGAT
jgi:hypothetical protein